MRKLFIAAALYLVLGLLSGVFYREFTRATQFDGRTGLSSIHTHTLVLGTLFFLLLIVIDKNFELSEQSSFTHWFVLYNVGLLWTVAGMTAQGVVTVLHGQQAWGLALSGIVGIGHIVVAMSWVWLCRIIYVAIRGDMHAGDHLHFR